MKPEDHITYNILEDEKHTESLAKYIDMDQLLKPNIVKQKTNSKTRSIIESVNNVIQSEENIFS